MHLDGRRGMRMLDPPEHRFRPRGYPITPPDSGAAEGGIPPPGMSSSVLLPKWRASPWFPRFRANRARIGV